MTRAALALGLAGAAVATALVARAGFAAVGAALAAAGQGVLWASLAHVLPMVLNARAWQVLVGGGHGRRSLRRFTWLVWVREAVNGLLPVARVGGEVVTARLMLRGGIPGPQAAASLIVDLTVGLGTQLVFTLGGIGVLAGAAGRTSGGPLARAAAAVLAFAVPVVVVVVLLQRAGAFEAAARVGRALAGGRLAGVVASGRRLDRAIRALHRRPARLLRSAAWQLAGWVAGAAELWVLLAFLGRPASALDALALEAVVQALSSAAFLVPGALGVQEGGFAAAGAALGLPPQVALALALARRARDLIVFVPALVAWQSLEGWTLARPGRRPGRAGARS